MERRNIFMDNLVKKNSKGQTVIIGCPYDDCGMSSPHCYDCAFVSYDNMLEIMNKLYKYEQTGLMFKE
jgi:hypothetical protein